MELALEAFHPRSRRIIKRVQDGPELLGVISGWRERLLLVDAFQRFKSNVELVTSLKECEEYFEELNAEVNRLVFNRRDETNDATTSYEQKYSGEEREILLENQKTSQLGRQASPLQPERRFRTGAQSSETASPRFPLTWTISQMRRDLPSRTISTDEKEAFEKIFHFIDTTTPRKIKRVVNM